MRIIYVPRSQQSGLPITYKQFANIFATLNNPTILSINVDASSTFMVLCVRTVSSSPRSYGVPTINGIPFVQVGDFAGNFRSEIWFLQNPPTGNQTISVPNSTNKNLYVTASTYECANQINLYGYTSYSGNSNISGGSVDVPQNKELLVIDSSVAISTAGTFANIATSNTIIWYGNNGAIFAAGSQYKTYKSEDNTTELMTWQYNSSLINWYNVIAVFKGI